MNLKGIIDHLAPGMAEVVERLYDLQRSQFYGTMEIKLERGSVVLMRESRTTKPKAYGNNRSVYDGQRS